MNTTGMIVLWACLTANASPGHCRFEPVEAFNTLAECKAMELTSHYLKMDTRCLPANVRLNPNGTIK